MALIQIVFGHEIFLKKFLLPLYGHFYYLIDILNSLDHIYCKGLNWSNYHVKELIFNGFSSKWG